MQNILIAGGSGLIGKALSEKLQAKGFNVRTLGRKANQLLPNHFTWDIDKQEIDKSAFSDVDYIINLSGAGIADKRWTKNRKAELLNSRINSTRLLFNTIKKRKLKLKAYIGASAVGFYGAITSEKRYQESDYPANDFLGETCYKWEQASALFNTLKIRTVILRMGVVLSNKGGALQKMLFPYKLGLGSPIGTGKQYMPWIHIGDLCDIYVKAIQDNMMQGIYNAIAPEDITNELFSKSLAKVLRKPYWLPKIPSWVLQLIFGEMADIILEGSRVDAQKIISTGFKFKFPTIEKALSKILCMK